MFKRNNKKLTKLIAATFMFNSVGGAFVPLIARAAEVSTLSSASQTATISSSTAEKINQLNDVDDDLEFLNRILALCSDKSSNTTTAENYKSIMNEAKEAKEKADAAGEETDSLAQTLVDADARVQRILQDVKNSKSVDVDSLIPDEDTIKTQQSIYSKALAEKRSCEATAAQNGTDESACVLSDAGKSAANYLITTGYQQFNSSSSNPTSTNATEVKGASTIQNKDVTYVKGDDGLYYEKTVIKEVACADDEVAENNVCIKKKTDEKVEEKTDEKIEDKTTDDTVKEDTKKDTSSDDTTKSDDTVIDNKTEDKTEDNTTTDKCTTGYVESNSQCCPVATPIYDSSAGQCVAESTDDGIATTSVSSGGGSNKKSALYAALGAIGVAAALGAFSGNEGKINEGEIAENSLQYAFNYNQVEKDGKAGGVHYFPANSKDDIKFKLFQYKLPTDANGKTGTPRAEATFTVPMRDKDGTVRGYTITIPIEIGKMEIIFPKTMKDSYYKPLRDKGTIERIPAEQLGLKDHYQMTVSAYDGISGHARKFYIKYDFTATDTMIVENEDKKLKKGNYTVEGNVASINADGYISEAHWDAKGGSDGNGQCILTVSGSFNDTVAGDQVNDQSSIVASNRFSETGCNKLNTDQGKKLKVHLQNMSTADDGTGKAYFVDDYNSSGSEFTIYAGIDDYVNDGNHKKQELFLNYKDYNMKATDLSNTKRPVKFEVTTASGEKYEWPGYSSNGYTLFDSKGDELTPRQKEGQVQIVCDKTGNTEVCNNGVKFDACSNISPPEHIGMVCLYTKDGQQKTYSTDGFSLSTVNAVGSQSAKEAEDQKTKNSESIFGKLTSLSSLAGFASDKTEAQIVNTLELVHGGAGANTDSKAAEAAANEKSGEPTSSTKSTTAIENIAKQAKAIEQVVEDAGTGVLARI